VTALFYYDWAHTTSLTPPLFIEVSAPRQEIERLYMSVRCIGFASFYMFAIGFLICCESVVLFVSHFICTKIGILF